LFAWQVVKDDIIKHTLNRRTLFADSTGS